MCHVLSWVLRVKRLLQLKAGLFKPPITHNQCLRLFLDNYAPPSPLIGKYNLGGA